MINRTSAGRNGDVRGRRSAVAVAVAAGLVLAACGSDAEETATATASSLDVTTTVAVEEDSDRSIVTTDDEAGEEDADVATTPSTTEAPEPTTTVAEDEPTESTIAGEPLDFGPSAGTPLAIVGVAFDDTLNFRVDPSPDADILVSHGPPLAELDISALGEAWAAPSGVWWKVDVGGTTAWANQAFLGSLGDAQFAFDQVAAELESLEYETFEAAVLAVAELRASEDPVSRIVVANELLMFEPGGFAIVDVLDLGDDSVKGERIRVDVIPVFDEESGEPGAQDITHLELTGVEITPICGRGLSGGLCT